MRITGVLLVTLHLLAGPLWGAGTTDWDAWYDGRVAVHLRLAGGEGSVVASTGQGIVRFEATQSAYHMVVALDSRGDMHLLFPRSVHDDGWVRRGSVQRLDPADHAGPGSPWVGEGVVHVEVIASPMPFAWGNLEVWERGDGCRLLSPGRQSWPVDAYRAFDLLHRQLFPRWDQALFAVDETWFFVGSRCEVPRWIRTRPRLAPSPVEVGITLRARWSWEFGAWCARPVYHSRPLPPPRHGVVRRSVVDAPPRLRTRQTPVVDPRVERKQVVQAAPQRVRQRNDRTARRPHGVEDRQDDRKIRRTIR